MFEIDNRCKSKKCWPDNDNKKKANNFFKNMGMRWLQRFWGPEIAGVWTLEDPLTLWTYIHIFDQEAKTKRFGKMPARPKT